MIIVKSDNLIIMMFIAFIEFLKKIILPSKRTTNITKKFRLQIQNSSKKTKIDNKNNRMIPQTLKYH